MKKKKNFESSPNFNIRKDLMDILMLKDGKEEIVSLDGLSASIIFTTQTAIYPSKQCNLFISLFFYFAYSFLKFSGHYLSSSTEGIS